MVRQRRRRIGNAEVFRIIRNRIIWSMILVTLTYNPVFSLVTYLGGQLGSADITTWWQVKALVVLLFVAAWIIFVRTALQGLGLFAVLIAAILLLGAQVILSQISAMGYTVGNEVFVWLGLFIMSVILGIGVAVGYINYAFAGVSNVDEVDSN